MLGVLFKRLLYKERGEVERGINITCFRVSILDTCKSPFNLVSFDNVTSSEVREMARYSRGEQEDLVGDQYTCVIRVEG